MIHATNQYKLTIVYMHITNNTPLMYTSTFDKTQSNSKMFYFNIYNTL